MLVYIILLLMLVKLNIFDGWLMGLWIAGIILHTLGTLIRVVIKIFEDEL